MKTGPNRIPDNIIDVGVGGPPWSEVHGHVENHTEHQHMRLVAPEHQRRQFGGAFLVEQLQSGPLVAGSLG